MFGMWPVNSYSMQLLPTFDMFIITFCYTGSSLYVQSVTWIISSHAVMQDILPLHVQVTRMSAYWKQWYSRIVGLVHVVRPFSRNSDGFFVAISIPVEDNWFAVSPLWKFCWNFFCSGVGWGLVRLCHFTDQFSLCNNCCICHTVDVEDQVAAVGCMGCPL